MPAGAGSGQGTGASEADGAAGYPTNRIALHHVIIRVSNAKSKDIGLMALNLLVVWDGRQAWNRNPAQAELFRAARSGRHKPFTKQSSKT